jgi:short-subunit dehydrogenase
MADEQQVRSDASIVLIVNNAGSGIPKPLLAQDTNELDTAIELNVVAAHWLAFAATQTFAARGHGGIINLSSISALHPEQVNATYTAAKAFVLNFTPR